MRIFHASSARGQRGVSLIEALVSFAVMAIGMLGVMGVQTTLRFNSDVSKQRSEATRLAQQRMETLRDFSEMTATPGARAYADIVSTGPTEVTGYTTNTTYRVNTVVQAFPDRRNVTLTVAWQDRQGGAQSVVLNSTIADIDPALSGLLSLPPHGSPQRNPRGRHAGIPLEAITLRDGRSSAFEPPGSSDMVWVFSNTTGELISVCTSLVGNEVSGCLPASGSLISGVVRFDTDGEVSAAEAENPLSSPTMDLQMVLSPQGDGFASPAFRCFDRPVPFIPAVRYHCIVFTTSSDVRWSGRLGVDLFGLTLGATVNDFRICRYSADYNGRNGIENLEHPLNYSNVFGALLNQNFLVIRGDSSCPSDVAANPASGDFVNSNTVEQAPNPA